MLRRFIPFLAALVLLTLQVIVPASAQLYTVTDLGASTASATGVNDNGFVTGATSSGYAYVWSPITGTIKQLPVVWSLPNGGLIINSLGDVAGTHFSSSIFPFSELIDHGCFWDASGRAFAMKSFADLGPSSAINYDPNYGVDNPNGPYTANQYFTYFNDSAPQGIYAGSNKFVVGYATTLVSTLVLSNSGSLVNHLMEGPDKACYWLPAASPNPRSLPPFAGLNLDTSQITSLAIGINKSGLIAGMCSYAYDPSALLPHACVWNLFNPTTAPEDLEAGNAGWSEATAISDLGQVAGINADSNSNTTCIWTKSSDGRWHRDDIIEAPWNIEYLAYEINNNGEVFGFISGLADGTLEPFIWSPSTRMVKNPNDLVTGWKLTAVGNITDSGYIAATGYVNGGDPNQTHGLLLRPVVWGARVRLIRKSTGQIIRDHLVSVENGLVTLLSGLSFDPNGNVVADPNAQIPVNDIVSIQVYPDQFDPNSPDGGPTEQGFNKYIVDGITPTGTTGVRAQSIRTVRLEGYAGGNFSYSITSVNVGDDGTTQIGLPNALYAIPRCPADPPAATTIKNWLINAAANPTLAKLSANKYRRIPPQILYAIAWLESPDAEGNGWNQFGYITLYNTAGRLVYQTDAVGNTKTIVTYDGGIGMMQVNDVNILGPQTKNPNYGRMSGGTLPQGMSIINHLWLLASNTEYNIQAGAYVLCKMRCVPAIASGQIAQEVFEDWYLSVQNYNPGLSGYADSIWALIQDPPQRLQDAGILAVENLSVPGTPHFPFPAHADLSFRGIADVEIEPPSVTEQANGYLLVVNTVLLPQGTQLSSLQVLLGGNPNLRTSMQQEAATPGIWTLLLSNQPPPTRRFYLNGNNIPVIQTQ